MVDANNIDPRKLSTAEFAGLLAPVTDNGIGAIDPQAFTRLIKHASAEQLGAVLGDPTPHRALRDRIFSLTSGQLRPKHAPDRDSAIHWRITDGPGDDEVHNLDHRDPRALDAAVLDQQRAVARSTRHLRQCPASSSSSWSPAAVRRR